MRVFLKQSQDRLDQRGVVTAAVFDGAPLLPARQVGHRGKDGLHALPLLNRHASSPVQPRPGAAFPARS